MDSGDTTIRYQTKHGKPAAFADGDFDDLSELLTGEHLNYVRFQLPDSGEGTLYYDYDDGKYASKVSASRNYYRSSSAYLDRVSFVPDENFYGTVKIGFTGWNTKGERFEGTIEITVEEPAGRQRNCIYHPGDGAALPKPGLSYRLRRTRRGRATGGALYLSALRERGAAVLQLPGYQRKGDRSAHRVPSTPRTAVRTSQISLSCPKRASQAASRLAMRARTAVERPSVGRSASR